MNDEILAARNETLLPSAYSSLKKTNYEFGAGLWVALIQQMTNNQSTSR